MERLTAKDLNVIERRADAVLDAPSFYGVSGVAHQAMAADLKRTLAEVRRLGGIVERLERTGSDLAHAMRRSVDAGCTNRLDCCYDGGQFWYDALKMWEEAASAAPRAAGEQARTLAGEGEG